VNPPTCGWGKLNTVYDKIVNVPGTVEEHFWGDIGGVIPDVGGDYVGVSWWSTTFTLDPDLLGKRLIIRFESVNLRAEVFVNSNLVGYDVIGNTPFEVDATDAVIFEGENRIDVRITDPVGNFSWNDNILMRWGKNLVPAVHGFGGITGPVTIEATDAVHLDDIYVQNKPDPKNAEVFITLGNSSGKNLKGNISLVIHEWKKPSQIVLENTISIAIPSKGKEISFKVSAPDAKLWGLSGHRTFKQANLYEASVVFTGDDGKINDSKSQRFGFRWFDVGEKNGDKRFYLNGKRVFIIAAMTRGFWPKNGIFATPEMAERDMNVLIDLGFNMMLLHRAIGQPPVMDYCDRMGLMTYEEPSGYRIMPNRMDNIDAPDEQSRVWRREKLKRMVIRDRSLPSMVIYNLKNEAQLPPDEDDIQNMKMVHDLDSSRILTYNSDRNRSLPQLANEPDDAVKSWMRPFDDRIYTHGWWDHHHWYPFGGYTDDMYNNPQFYRHLNIVQGDSLHRVGEDEILFWGEEGGWGTMVRLGRIRQELMTTGATGFREMEHLDWYEEYNSFLDKSGFRSVYPTVDDLTLSIGRNKHYYHGRAIENTRMGNISDGYDLNGWASALTRSDIVDQYRNPTGPPEILQHYTQPLYVAVKFRDKVLPVDTVPVVDFWIINEENLNGKNTLEISLDDTAGRTIFTDKFIVDIKGGEEFGQLLVEGVKLPALQDAGYYMLNAAITNGGYVKATGFDDIFAVDYMSGPGFSRNCAVIEDGFVIKDFIRSARGINVQNYSQNVSNLDIIIVGTHNFGDSGGNIYSDILKRVANGTKLIVLDHADLWAEAIDFVLRTNPPLYNGGGIVKRGHRGRYFVGNSSYLDGLPRAQAMNWEYQCFYQTRELARGGNVSGINLHHWAMEPIVAMSHQHTKDIFISLARVPVGNGEVFLTTMNFMYRLGDYHPQSAVAKKLFLNIIEISGENK
ncbi:glycoside hydrolase family 2 protein, partial [Candidatus Latescibacterota bacterium]